MRAVLYARVSSAAQKERNTIASQLAELPRFIASRGWTLARPADTYVDDGRSAKAGQLEQREAFRRLLADAARGVFDVVAVVDQDRLTRSESQRERGAILGAFAEAGVRIAVSSTGQILDLNSDEGDLLSSLGSYFAAAENRKRRERTVRGKIEAAKKGRKPAGPTLYGYRYDRATGVWSIDEEAAAFVRESFDRVAAGETCYRVCLDLQARGAFRPRGGNWNRARVHTLVTNRGYTGRLVVDKVRGLAVTVPRIVSDALFDRAAAALRRTVRPPRSRHYSLLEGIARCGICGGKIGITGRDDLAPSDRTRGRSKVQRYYWCRARPSCGLRMLPIRDVDPVIWAELEQAVERPDRVARARQQASTDGRGGQDWAADLASYERQLGDLDRREAAILERFRRGRVSEAAMDRELEASARHRALLERNRDLARQELASARRSRAETEALLSSLQDVRARVRGASAAQKQELARLLVPGTDGYQVTLWPHLAEIVGRLRTTVAATGGASISPASAASSSSEPSQDVVFRRFATL